MTRFENITEDILRLKVPFENIYTAVFLIKTASGAILVDAAASKHDAETVILPALGECVDIRDIKYLFCTHLHGDHGGGIRHLLPHLRGVKVAAASARAIELYGEENVQIVRGGDSLCGIDILSLKGHSHDSMGLYDNRTKTLLTGDGIQLCGITKYGTGVECPEGYRETLARVRALGANMLVASHEYYPLGAEARGDAVDRYIDEAVRAYSDIENFVRENAALGDAVAIAAAYTKAALQNDENMTRLQSYTVKALLEEK